MNEEKYKIIEKGQGFIAALDQSGGSSAKTLKNYGIDDNQYKTEVEMFDLIHEMRTRVIKSASFTSEKILGVILFEETMNRKIDNNLTADYLWNKKHIISFLKIDKGLKPEENGVQLMKPILNLDKILETAVKRNIFGTKMRSVIKENNKLGIKRVVEQQFSLAKVIMSYGLVPIIEPEVSIDSPTKESCEAILKEEILNQLNSLPANSRVMLKLTLPSIPNFYKDLTTNTKVLKVVALSGGYSKKEACLKLKENDNIIASFSRALLEDLKVSETTKEFDKCLADSISLIYNASVNK